MQSAIVERMEKRLSASVDNLSPDAVLQKWFLFGADGSARIQEFLKGVFGGAARAGAGDKKD